MALVCSASLSCLFGQESAPVSSPEPSTAAAPSALPEPLTAPPPVPAEFAEPALSAVELDNLVAPLALYPDALVALILPAATEPSDLVLAARFLRSQPKPEAEIEAQPWIDSVKLLARYPTVIAWLDQELAWTKRLGEAFALQPADVMTAIQRRRAQARASGALRTTPQHVVSEVGSNIVIVPARPEVIYVPVYDPFAVYVSAPIHRTRVVVTFGRAYSCGYWLAYGCDWGRRTICYVDRPHRVRVWREPPRTTVIVTRTWSHPSHDPSPHWRTWSPSPHRFRSESGARVRTHGRPGEPRGAEPVVVSAAGSGLPAGEGSAAGVGSAAGAASFAGGAPASGGRSFAGGRSAAGGSSAVSGRSAAGETSFGRGASRSVVELGRSRAEAAGVVARAYDSPQPADAVSAGNAVAGSAERASGSRPTFGARPAGSTRSWDAGRGRDAARPGDGVPAGVSNPAAAGAPVAAAGASTPAPGFRSGSRRGEIDSRTGGPTGSRSDRSTTVIAGDGANTWAGARPRSSRIESPRTSAPAIADSSVLQYTSPAPADESRGSRWGNPEAGRSRAGVGGGERSFETRSGPSSGIVESIRRGGSVRGGERDGGAGERLPD